jgi:acyl carrier protein
VNEITTPVKEFIMSNFLAGEDPEELTTSTPLITTGLLDSLQRLDLVYFLEERFGITLEAHEVDPSRMDTLEQIARLVEAKMAAKR